MAWRVNVENFDGPFDLLLELVSRQKVDIGSISIVDIIDQYLAEIQHAQNLDLDVASDFLFVAATLLTIKAESLLEVKHEPLEDELQYLSPAQARELLIDQLVTYKTYKNAATFLGNALEDEGKWHARPYGPDNEFRDMAPDFLKGVTLEKLGDLAAKALARRENFILDAQHIASKPIPVEVYVKMINERIVNKKHLRFSELVDKNTAPSVIVVTFLAILELYKRCMVTVQQDVEFGDIVVEAIPDAPAYVLQEEEREVRKKGSKK